MAHILVIDDDDSFRRLLCDFLTDAGHEVSSARDSAAAMADIGERVPDLVILDYQMPGITGTGLLAYLRTREETLQLPVIFLSGVNIITFSNEVPPDPRVRFMSKPLDFPILKVPIAELLSLNAAPAERPGPGGFVP